jgi:two-component system capsular synthesis sensor histidine kinase RcsC
VFTNLIGNAVKFTESGRVTVRARAAPGQRVVVEVEDTGVGIRPESLKTIWEPFRQADYKVSRKFGGTGLGLAIVSGVVRRLGGTVSVDSTVGIGTTFSVFLPTPASGPAPALGPQSSARVSRATLPSQ